MARLRNTTTGVIIDVADTMVDRLHPREWEPVDQPAPTAKPATKAAKASAKPAK